MAWAPPVAPVISHGGSAAMKPWPKTSHRATTRRPSAKRCGRGASYGEGRRPADGRRWFRWRMIDRHLHRLIPSPYRWSMMVPNMWFHSLQNHAWCLILGGRDPAAQHQVQLEDGTWGRYEEDVACLRWTWEIWEDFSKGTFKSPWGLSTKKRELYKT